LAGAHRRFLGRALEDSQQDWDVAFSPRGDRVASLDGPSGDVRIWSATDAAHGPLRVLHGPACNRTCAVEFGPQGRHLAQMGPDNALHLWDLEGPPEARPLVFGRPGPSRAVVLDPTGNWAVTYAPAESTIDFWPLAGPRRRVIGRPAANRWLLMWSMAFTADGRWLATCNAGEPARLWPVSAADGRARDIPLHEPCRSLAAGPAPEDVLVSTGKKVALSAVRGGPPRLLAAKRAWGVTTVLLPVALDPRGGRAVATPFEPWGVQEPAARVLHVWDLPSGRERVHSIARLTEGFAQFSSLNLAPDGSVYVAGQGGVRRLVLPESPGAAVSSERIHAAGSARSDLSRDGTLLLVAAGPKPVMATQEPLEELILFDLKRRTSHRITSHGARLTSLALSPSGRVVVTGDADGLVRAGPSTGEEPHLLFGHKGRVTAIALSPDERWIATASEDALSLWPMPDVAKPPLHTLPHAELLAKLATLTNLRVVRDPQSATGWTLDVGPFPGWKDVPAW
jgi:WD40 repeat protein